MTRLDRYILAQLTGPFAVFALILIGIYWVGRAIGLFDQLIADGQSVGVFLEIMVLFLPQVVAIVLPVVSFAAALFVTNRLHGDSEMVVLQAAGLSPGRILRPFALFAMMVALLAGVLSHLLVPASQSRLAQRQSELSRDMASRLIVGGRFLHPAENVTFFVREIAPDGALLNVFLHDQRMRGSDVTYTARKAIVFRNGDQARLVMFDGLILNFDREKQLLSKIEFDEFVFDVATLVGADRRNGARLQDFSTLALLFPTPAMLAALDLPRAAFVLEAHKRIEQPLQSLLYPMLGMAVLMLGGYSRFGVFRQVMGAIVLVVVLNALAMPLRSMVAEDPRLWPLFYLPDALGFVLVWLMLRDPRRRRRPPAVAAPLAGEGAA